MQSLSNIQDYIISRLKNADTLRYRDMKPTSSVPNDLYNYHLKALIARGLIAKVDTGYRLTDDGIRYVADMHHTSDVFNRLFKINPILIVSRQTAQGAEILSQFRTAQPSYGKRGVPGGTITKGEPLLVGAARKLREETGLNASLRVVGQERRIQYKDNELFSDIIFPICYADTHSGSLTDTTFGTHSWVPIDEAINNESSPTDSIESITAVLSALRDDRISNLAFFYVETSQTIR